MSTVKILGGVYRMVKHSGEHLSMRVGDICILIQDDGDYIPMFYNPKWFGKYQYSNISHMELIGVFEGD